MINRTSTVSDSHSPDALSALRTRFVQLFAIIALISLVLGLPVVVFSDLAADEKLVRVGITLVIAVLSGGLLRMTHSGHTREASLLLVLVFLAGSFITLYLPGWLVLAATLTIIAAATLVSRPVFLVTAGGVLAIAALNVVLLVNAGPQTDLTSGVLLFFTLLVVAVVMRLFIERLESAILASQRANQLLSSVAEVGDRLSQYLRLNELLSEAVELIRERFDYYHVQIFLLDERAEAARLVASTGDVGRMLLERQHRLLVGSRSVIGRVTASRAPVIARDTDPFYFRNELLPQTRSELALPIFDGDRLIGALDVQSQRQDDFTSEIVRAMLVLANLLGTSIRNVRLLDRQEQSAQQAQHLLAESEENLREIQRLNQMLTRSGWEEFLNRTPVQGIQVGQTAVESVDAWTPAQLEAMRSQQPVQDMREGVAVLAVPIVLANRSVGAVEVEIPASGADSETLDMLKSVARRLALSLDKARLFEEAQEVAAREQQINAIVSRFQAVSSVDDLLQIALKEMTRSLGAQHGSIRLAAGAPGLNGDRHA